MTWVLCRLIYDEPTDGENQRTNRKEAVVDMFKETQANIISIQEGLHHQLNYLDENLSNYKYVGVGRDDGHSSGEYAAIFYKTDCFELLKSGNFWLSETPQTPSLGWDANNIRIVTWLKLKDLERNKTIYVFNTHFDHIGKIAQEKSSQLLIRKIDELTEKDAPIFITGDFNMLIGNSSLSAITRNFFSAQRFANKSDDTKSHNAFGRWYLNRNIDFIFYKNASALSYKTIVKNYGVPYISDHYPIISHFNLKSMKKSILIILLFITMGKTYAQSKNDWFHIPGFDPALPTTLTDRTTLVGVLGLAVLSYSLEEFIFKNHSNVNYYVARTGMNKEYAWGLKNVWHQNLGVEHRIASWFSLSAEFNLQEWSDRSPKISSRDKFGLGAGLMTYYRWYLFGKKRLSPYIEYGTGIFYGFKKFPYNETNFTFNNSTQLGLEYTLKNKSKIRLPMAILIKRTITCCILILHTMGMD